MRPFVVTAAASLLLVPLALLASAKDKPAAAGETSGSCGTSIDFYDSPKDAAKAALKEQKLVFVLHVSGNFEDPRFT
jgi:hypothetical protein